MVELFHRPDHLRLRVTTHRPKVCRFRGGGGGGGRIPAASYPRRQRPAAAGIGSSPPMRLGPAQPARSDVEPAGAPFGVVWSRGKASLRGLPNRAPLQITPYTPASIITRRSRSATTRRTALTSGENADEMRAARARARRASDKLAFTANNRVRRRSTSVSLSNMPQAYATPTLARRAFQGLGCCPNRGRVDPRPSA